MTILFDLVHPADALFFHHPIRALQAAGRRVVIASRHKDVLPELLDEIGFSHTPLTRAGQGAGGLARELVLRDWRLWRLARRFRPDVMVGFGGVTISHVGKLTGIPSLSFYDTEHAELQIRLAVPFLTEWHVPTTWEGRIAKGRTHYFEGGKQFAYLHPDHFRPSREIAEAAGYDRARENFMIRTVAWRANHDHGRGGIPPEQLRAIVERLGARGKVHISAEGDLPPDLEQHRYRGKPLQFHHLLAHCRLHCGESITIASEAVMLGVPVLLQIDKEYCYITEQQEAGLIWRFGPDDNPDERLDQALSEDPASFRERARKFIAAKGDLNRYIVEQIHRVGERRAR